MMGEQFNIVEQIFMGHFQQFSFKAHTVGNEILLFRFHISIPEEWSKNFSIFLQQNKNQEA